MHVQRMTERKDQLERLRRRYAGRGKEGKSRLLDEFCEQHGYERKYASKLLQGRLGCAQAKPRLAPSPISAATLDRLLAQCKARGREGKNGTRPGSLLRH